MSTFIHEGVTAVHNLMGKTDIIIAKEANNRKRNEN